ncbi:hypothetical protein TCCBUS3UF1_2210 [Thermus sp. CCB_US3_UF1]|nr:hypothetical protein TCCBUS3UF1_2210 [Thermus sp. CCB_US3_UF1]
MLPEPLVQRHQGPYLQEAVARFSLHYKAGWRVLREGEA